MGPASQDAEAIITKSPPKHKAAGGIAFGFGELHLPPAALSHVNPGHGAVGAVFVPRIGQGKKSNRAGHHTPFHDRSSRSSPPINLVYGIVYKTLISLRSTYILAFQLMNVSRAKRRRLAFGEGRIIFVRYSFDQPQSKAHRNKQHGTAFAQKNRSISLSSQILIGLSFGLLVGLFFGDKASVLAIIGKAYIGLIQMSILPYMVVSLMLGIGSLSYDKARKLAITGGLVLIASWALAFAIVFLMPIAFPTMKAGSFFSASLVQAAEVDFIDLYIPTNPFSSLARTVVPAAAVFSVAFGIALIGVENKRSLLDILTATSKTLSRIAMMVVKLTPIGIFAIAANAAGTMTIAEFGRLQSYIIPFIVATLLLSFWILPGLTAALTPFSYRQILQSARAALTTGFVTGNLFITLPMLVESARSLFADQNLHDEDTGKYVEVLVPTSFNCPNIGKLLTLLFLLFAGWFVGKSVEFTDYPGFAVLGLFTLFGGVDLALPFLLDQMQIPSDMYQLYVVTGVLNSWFATLLAVMNLFAFTLVATCAATGELQVNWPRISRFAAISFAVFYVVLLGTRFALSIMVTKDDMTRRTLMQAVIV